MPGRERSAAFRCRQATSALSAGLTAAVPRAKDEPRPLDPKTRMNKRLSHAVTVLDQVYAHCASIVMAKATGRDARFWVTTVGTVAVILEGSRQTIKYPPNRFEPRPFEEVVSQFGLGMAMVHLVNVIVDVFPTQSDLDANMLLFDLIATFQSLGGFAVRYAKRPLPYQSIAIYALIQGGLTGVRTWLAVKEPL
jgi:hypothetical protein